MVLARLGGIVLRSEQRIMKGHFRLVLLRVFLVAVPVSFIGAVLPGCLGISANPLVLGNLPTGDIVQTHAKPMGLGYYRNFDPAAKMITITPTEAVGAVGTQHILIATVCDKNSKGRRNRRVEWHVSGAGHIVEVDESGYFHGRGYKVDDQYAVSYTNYRGHKLTRGNDDPSDDIQLKAGQSWCVITSPEEGTTHVTCYAPGIYDWEKHKVFAVKHWVNVVPVFPQSAVNPAGQPHRMTTQLLRGTDRSPAAGYHVRYRVLDGPPAVFDPGGAMVSQVVSDTLGNATVVLRQLQPAPGVNRIAVEVVRPSDSPTGKQLVVGRHELTKTWVAPQLSIQKAGPASAVVGGQIQYQITVLNTGSAATTDLQIRDILPQNLQLVSANPPATQQGSNVIWQFGPLGPSQSAAVQLICQPAAAGQYRNCAEAIVGGAVVGQSCAETAVVTGALSISKTGPATAVIGQPVTFNITVTNQGNGPAANVVVKDEFDQGFVHQTGAGPVQLTIGTLAPGQSRTETIVLMPRAAGRLCNRVFAEAAGGLHAEHQHCVEVAQPQLTINKIHRGAGPTVAVGNPVDFELEVVNRGAVAAPNVVVRDPLPPGLQLQEVLDGGVAQGNTAVWNLGTLDRGQGVKLRLRAIAVQAGENICNVATVESSGSPQVPSKQSCISIVGVPALLTELIDRADPVPVGAETTYAIRITNQGSKPAIKVELECSWEEGMDYVGAETLNTIRISPDQKNRKVRFAPFNIDPGKQLIYQVQMAAKRVGDWRFVAIVSGGDLKKPLTTEESTRVYDPRSGKYSFKGGKPDGLLEAEPALLPASAEPSTNEPGNENAGGPVSDSTKTDKAEEVSTPPEPNALPLLKPVSLSELPMPDAAASQQQSAPVQIILAD